MLKTLDHFNLALRKRAIPPIDLMSWTDPNDNYSEALSHCHNKFQLLIYIARKQWSHGRVDCNGGNGGSIPPVQKLRQFCSPHICLSFGKDTKSRWSLLSGVCARRSNRSHTRGKCVTCRLVDSLILQNSEGLY